MMERIPILKMGDVLIVSIQIDLTDHLALSLQEDLANRIVSSRACGVIIDISSLPVVDSFLGRMLGTIATTARVLDAVTVLVGMSPAVAITLVELGIKLPGVRTAHNVDKAMKVIRASTHRTSLMTGIGESNASLEAADDAPVD